MVNSAEEALKRAYGIIAFKLNTEDTEDRNLRYWVHQLGMDDIDGYEDVLNEETVDTNESISIGEHMYQHLKGKQFEIIDTILHSVNDTTPRSKCFVIDGPGGTGKTSLSEINTQISRNFFVFDETVSWEMLRANISSN